MCLCGISLSVVISIMSSHFSEIKVALDPETRGSRRPLHFGGVGRRDPIFNKKVIVSLAARRADVFVNAPAQVPALPPRGGGWATHLGDDLPMKDGQRGSG